MPRSRRHAPPLWTRLVAAVAVCWLAIAAAAHAELTRDDWPAFRGDSRNLTEAKLPIEWSVETGKNIAWSADLPGRGVSSPIVVGGRVIVTCSGGEKESQLSVLAFDAETGKELWRRDFEAKGNVTINELTAVAANTPTTDGERIFALFSSNDMFVLDLDGKELWSKNLTAEEEGLGNDFGMASSPVVVDGAVVVQCNGETSGFIAAFNVADGSLKWREQRSNQASWTSPFVIAGAAGSTTPRGLVIQSPKGVELLDCQTGKLLDRIEMECDAIASSTFDGQRLYVPAKWLMAVEFNPEQPNGEPVWEAKRLKPTSASPVLRDGMLYAVNRGGVLNCFDVAKEKIAWTKRLGGSVWATPLSTPTHLYCFNAKGAALVLDLAGEVVFELEMDSEFLASPAVSGNAMFIRSHKRLWKIAE